MTATERTDTLGARLAWARQTAGLSVSQAARMIGVHPHTILASEANSTLISSAVVESLAIAYDVDSKWVNTGVERTVVLPDMPKVLREERESLRRLFARARQGS